MGRRTRGNDSSAPADAVGGLREVCCMHDAPPPMVPTACHRPFLVRARRRRIMFVARTACCPARSGNVANPQLDADRPRVLRSFSTRLAAVPQLRCRRRPSRPWPRAVLRRSPVERYGFLPRTPYPRGWAHDRPDSRWQGHRSSDQVRSGRPRGGAGSGASRPASARCSSGTTPAARSTSRASTATARRSASPPSSANCPPPRRQEEIEAVVRELNEDPACTGYIVQLPLPQGHRHQPRPGADGSRPRTRTACTR